MTIRQLLGTSIDELEKMTDEELRAHLAPYIIAQQPVDKTRVGNVIDVSGNLERVEKRKESAEDFIKRMTQMMMAKTSA